MKTILFFVALATATTLSACSGSGKAVDPPDDGNNGGVKKDTAYWKSYWLTDWPTSGNPNYTSTDDPMEVTGSDTLEVSVGTVSTIATFSWNIFEAGGTMTSLGVYFFKPDMSADADVTITHVTATLKKGNTVVATIALKNWPLTEMPLIPAVATDVVVAGGEYELTIQAEVETPGEFIVIPEAGIRFIGLSSSYLVGPNTGVLITAK